MFYQYQCSLAPSKKIEALESKMAQYYNNIAYHREFVDGYNKTWNETFKVQLAAVSMISPSSTVVEVGCGAGDAKAELCQRIPQLRYIGIDLNWRLWPHGQSFVAASAATLPLANKSADVVLSMYVIEHLCRPREFLDEAWRVAQRAVIVIAPDFTRKPMASETAGFSYGSGTEKMKQGRWLDALLTGVANKLILASRASRTQRLRKGRTEFPILLNPRCLRVAGFVPDCDAVYPVSPLEIDNHYSARPDFCASEVFYNDGSSFGAIYRKRALL